jgi:hypothetical protein
MVRGLTPKERKEVFKQTGCTLTNFSEEKFEEIMLFVNELVAPDKEFKDFKEESDFFSEVIKLTYSVSEADEKN